MNNSKSTSPSTTLYPNLLTFYRLKQPSIPDRSQPHNLRKPFLGQVDEKEAQEKESGRSDGPVPANVQGGIHHHQD